MEQDIEGEECIYGYTILRYKNLGYFRHFGQDSGKVGLVLSVFESSYSN